MKKGMKTSLIVFLVLTLLAIGCMTGANAIQTDGGKVKTELGSIETDLGELTYKLYIPASVSEASPAPAVLLLHGYQNDHETSAAYALELARRGVVVLALDEYGHGKTSVSMINRGYVNHKVTTTYGTDEDGKTYLAIGGQQRYRVMMNFSNLSFFIDRYSKDNDGNSVKDSSMGGVAAYAYLATLPYVDSTRMGISGHSMGTWASWSVAAAYSGTDIMPRATVLQCGELFTENAYDAETIKFNNVLELTAKYDEFNYFRDYKNTVSEDLIKSDLRTGFLGTTSAEAEWNTTYGSFAEGTARRCELIMTNHRLTTHNSHAITTAVEWFTEALGIQTTLKSDALTFAWKELLVLIATLAVIASMMPLMNLLLETPFFRYVKQPLPTREVKTGWKWWKGAVITILIAAFTYPFLCQLGHGLLPLPDTTVFRMTIGNGFLTWYLFLIVVMLATTILPNVRAKKKGRVPMNYHEMGLAAESHSAKFDWKLLGKSALLTILMVGFMYLMTILFESLFLLDLRYIWPFFKGFTGERFVQFLIYIPVFALFFILNNSKIFAQMRNKYTNVPGAKGFFGSWWRSAFCMIGGIVLLCFIEYIPFFAGIGPGVDLLFSTTFGGPFMSLMIVFIPQVLVFSLIDTYVYRKTGNIYTGALTVACLACWIVTGGSAIL